MSKMKEWILSNDIASEQEIQNIELKATENAKNARNSAWKAFNQDLKKDHDLALQLINEAVSENTSSGEFTKLHEKFTQ